MTRPLRIQFPGAFYHVTSRGNEKKDIFIDEKDRLRFLFNLETAVVRYQAVIHVYCLMNNHYHLLLETPEGNLSSILHHINTSYTTYFNKKRNRVGHLFQGRFRSILIDRDSYALELSRYIHLNPVRAGWVNKPEDFKWSSFKDYLSETINSHWLYTKLILSYFNQVDSASRSRYKEFVYEGLREELENPLKNTHASVVLGKDQFLDEVRSEHIDNKEINRDLPAINRLKKKYSINQIIVLTEETLRINSKEKRRIALFLCHQYSGKSLKEIGNEFGQISQAAVTQNSFRIRKRLRNDIDLTNKIEKLKEIIFS
ncbi:MAG: transposase [Candidatus Aminicenantes bacterium]|nr:MAG: transposase [Candidatus Aminicenantes bacterium]